MEGIPDSTDLIDERLSDDSKEKLEELIGEYRSEESGGSQRHTNNKVPVSLCEIMKDLKEEGLSLTEIADICPVSSKSTVHYHVSDQCTHDSREHIRHSECGWIRYKAGKGVPTSELAEEYGVDYKTIRVHAKGECNHEHECPTVHAEKLMENERERYTVESECPVCGETFTHKRYNERTTCSYSCSSKYAAQASNAQRTKADD